METVKFKSEFWPITVVALEVAKDAKQGWLPICAASFIMANGSQKMWVFSNKIVDEEAVTTEQLPIDNKPVLQ